MEESRVRVEKMKYMQLKAFPSNLRSMQGKAQSIQLQEDLDLQPATDCLDLLL